MASNVLEAADMDQDVDVDLDLDLDESLEAWRECHVCGKKAGNFLASGGLYCYLRSFYNYIELTSNGG